MSQDSAARPAATPAEDKGVKTVYHGCAANCGSNHQCVFKSTVKDGKVIRTEPDDRYNTGVGREDEALSEEQLIKTHLQRRPCTKGLVFYRYLYRPDRIIYPLKRDPSAKRGEGKFIRISWDEAISTIASKMQEVREKYGPYSIIIPYMPNEAAVRLFSFWGAGTDSWGWCSFDATRMMAHIVAGEKGWDYPGYSSGSPADMLAHSKMVVIWGMDPTMGSCGPGFQFAWFVRLCRERGKRVIIFDPKYTPAAEVLADQWIPIKPGTDAAMFMALANVIFKADRWDNEFVARYVEPEGFEKWQRYVMGEEDGVEKTPEWAEKQCAVPAETIRGLAQLIMTERPAWLWNHWGANRKSRGENTVRAFAALQAMLGCWGTPGAGPALQVGSSRHIPVQASWGPPGDYHVPMTHRSHYWAEAVLLLDKVRRGDLSEKDYMRMVGWKADPAILKDFNPKFLFWGGGHKPHGSDFLVTACNTASEQLEALERMEFFCMMQSTMTPTARHADIILPALDWMWEQKNVFKTLGYGGFEAINYCPGVVPPPGETRALGWFFCQLAEKLGIDPKQYFRYYTTSQNWDQDWERYQRDNYQLVIDYYQQRNIKVPSWEEFTRGAFINCDELEDEPFTGFDEQIKEGKPFQTASGKIELYSRYIADEANRGTGEHYDYSGRLYDNLPSDWGDTSPYPVYKKTVRGMDDPLVKQYPLFVMAPHQRYRVHYLFWEQPWLRNHVYQHRVWISTPDAHARGIRDGDLVTVYNDRGRLVMPAYVTSRLMPGAIVIRHGGKYIPDENGVDFGAAASTLMGGDFESCITPAHATTVAQVEKYQGGQP
ncbi:MAG: molybdopterin-dependent oxidoreductase [Chloroflexota bacterium]